MIQTHRMIMVGMVLLICNSCCLSIVIGSATITWIGTMGLVVSLASSVIMYVLLAKTTLYAKRYQRAYEEFKKQTLLIL